MWDVGLSVCDFEAMWATCFQWQPLSHSHSCPFRSIEKESRGSERGHTLHTKLHTSIYVHYVRRPPALPSFSVSCLPFHARSAVQSRTFASPEKLSLYGNAHGESRPQITCAHPALGKLNLQWPPNLGWKTRGFFAFRQVLRQDIKW